jgi:hypothetical protein
MDGDGNVVDSASGEADSELAAKSLTRSYDIFILSSNNGRMDVYTNDIDQVYEAVSEFISADEASVKLTGCSKDGDEWTTRKLADWTSESTIDYTDRNVQALAEFVTR